MLFFYFRQWLIHTHRIVGYYTVSNKVQPSETFFIPWHCIRTCFFFLPSYSAFEEVLYHSGDRTRYMLCYTGFMYVWKPNLDSIIRLFSVSRAGWIWSHSSSDFCGLFIFRFEWKKSNGVICCVWSWREGKEPMEPETSKTVRGLQK